MKVVADLHLHSKYSRAVSKQMEPEIIAQWAKTKGVNLIATGDWTHPLWLKELESTLEEAGKGIYKIKGQEKDKSVNYVLSTEISSIYSQGGKGRRIHNLVMAPSFKIVHKINDELKKRGCNLMSDGRPIIGLSSIQLAELVWSIDEKCIIIPAHVWTPWFSMFGSKSGFDSIEECWGKFSDRIYAIETGLSSSPAMNWRIKDFDNRTIVSFGDAHSPAKIGRETTVFELKELSFDSLAKALASRANKDKKNKVLYTVEFYPEEGKYHYTGHRKCKVRQSPSETKKKGSTCHVCGRELTLGVMHRIEELASRKEIKPIKKKNKAGLVGYYNPQDKTRPPYIMLVTLMEILSESFNVGVASKRVQSEYESLTKNLGSELDILTQIKLEEIETLAGRKMARAVEKVRGGNIVVDPGFDGVFGTVKIWPAYAEATAGEKRKVEQESLF